MSNIEIVIEEVAVTTKGKTTVFEVCYTDERQEQRAYVKGSTQYYDIPVFNAGIAKAEKVERKQIADLFECPPSDVRS
jgi:hypothetical protein